MQSTLPQLIKGLAMQFDVRMECETLPKALLVWEETLREFPLEAVAEACERVRSRPYKAITPAHIIQLIEGDENVLAAAIRELAFASWDTVWEYMSIVAHMPTHRVKLDETSETGQIRVPNIPSPDVLVERIGGIPASIYSKPAEFCDTARQCVANKTDAKWEKKRFIERFTDKLLLRRATMAEMREYKRIQAERHAGVIKLRDDRLRRVKALTAGEPSEDPTQPIDDMRRQLTKGTDAG